MFGRLPLPGVGAVLSLPPRHPFDKTADAMLRTFVALLCLCFAASTASAAPDPSLSAEQLKSLRKAAEQGYADAQFFLGWCYSGGKWAVRDYVEAYKWFNLAAMRGNTDATRLRREIADQMSEVEIAAAQRAARAWLKAH